ncbi:MAG: tetratricopeptide repeat protein [Actinomycetota bacterium]|nr:tetratricopeptide repeat protein [Actinomycetota bacterium]
MTTGKTTLSRFTPSLMAHELLERLFVARHRTLDAILARVDAAASSTERNHTLLVGPRGAGKTHLVSLAYHRIKEQRLADGGVQLAWLPEDPWTIVTYRHFLAAITDRLEPPLDRDVPSSAEELESLLIERAASGGPIVVLVENLDQILNAIGAEGQQRLRHLLQAHRSLLLIATSTRLDRTLSDQASPFYAFFTTTRLEPFDVDEAAAMLKAIAKEHDNDDLVAYLDSDQGRARLRTITHLAGGQPRMWAALASALTVGGLDDLVDLLLTRFDDLTPYYQEQLGRLSQHQRVVVAELAGEDRPINVRELADRLGIDQRSLGKTMSELVDRGWAAPTTSPVTASLDQRRTYYELAEPLARLSFQIKESRGEPLRLVIEFLKHWFDPTALGAIEPQGVVAEYVLLAREGHERDAVIAVTRRLHRLPATRAPAIALLGETDSAVAALATGDPELFLRLPAPVRAAVEEHVNSGRDLIEVRQELHRAAATEFGHIRHPEMEGWIKRAEEIAARASDTTAGQLLLAMWLGRAWRFDEANEVIDAATVGLGKDNPRLVSLRSDLAISYWSAGRPTTAIELEEQVVADLERVLGEEHPYALTARANLAVSYQAAGLTSKAIELLEQVAADRERLLGEEDPSTLTVRAHLTTSYWYAGWTTAAIELGVRVLADSERLLGEEHPDTLTARGTLAASYWSAGRTPEAIELLEQVVADRERVLGGEHPGTLTARANLAASYWSAGRTSEAIELFETVVADSVRLFGGEHPDTLTARANLAVSYQAAGRTSEAIELLETVVADSVRLRGGDHPDTLTARANLATSYASVGGTADAIELLEQVVADSERLLGEDHPDTLTVRTALARVRAARDP